MIDLTTINCWQRMDPELNIPQPWYTFPALDEIMTWDLKGKFVLEFGGGASTVWWNKKAKQVRTVETNSEYLTELVSLGFEVTEDIKGSINYWDIVIVDNFGDRDENVIKAFVAVKTTGIIVIDNWDQASMDWQPSEEIKDSLLSFPCKIYKQPGHPDWKTLICWM